MIRYHPDLIQGSDEWSIARRGLLTASEMKLIITPGTLKAASNDKERSHCFELLAQRLTGYVEPQYISDDMLRGQADEVDARLLYAQHYAPVQDMGFITNDKFGFILGCSPDGLVGDDGMIEAKSRRQKYQVETILSNVLEHTIPADYAIQVQTELLVTERQWVDFISFSGGLPMVTIRVYPIPEVQTAIAEAAAAFEERLKAKMDKYLSILESPSRLIPTDRRVEKDMFV